MKLVTFEDIGKRRRIGARTPAGEIVDLTAAYALLLKDVEEQQDAQRAAERHVPPNMRKLFMEGAVEDARKGFEYALQRGPQAQSPAGERIFYGAKEVKIKAPIIPRKFFHTAGNFREHHEEAQKAGFSHPVLPWIVFFQNIDAIVGPDEPVVYPPHLTHELDYEL